MFKKISILFLTAFLVFPLTAFAWGDTTFTSKDQQTKTEPAGTSGPQADGYSATNGQWSNVQTNPTSVTGTVNDNPTNVSSSGKNSGSEPKPDPREIPWSQLIGIDDSFGNAINDSGHTVVSMILPGGESIPIGVNRQQTIAKAKIPMYVINYQWDLYDQSDTPPTYYDGGRTPGPTRRYTFTEPGKYHIISTAWVHYDVGHWIYETYSYSDASGGHIGTVATWVHESYQDDWGNQSTYDIKISTQDLYKQITIPPVTPQQQVTAVDELVK